jgi:type VI secretion system protein ImpH
LIGDYFEVPVAVEEFCGAWFDLSDDQWTRLGGSAGGANQSLGNGAILGKRVWDQNAGITIRLGPLDLKMFRKLLPGGAAYRVLVDLARVYLGDEIEFSFKLELRDDQIPWAELRSAANSAVALGRLSWLRGGKNGDSIRTQAGALPIQGGPLTQGGR